MSYGVTNELGFTSERQEAVLNRILSLVETIDIKVINLGTKVDAIERKLHSQSMKDDMKTAVRDVMGEQATKNTFKQCLNYSLQNDDEIIRTIAYSRLNYEQKRTMNSGILDRRCLEQLECFSQKKVGEIVFDSNRDNWAKGTSVFHERVVNRKNFAILVDDGEGNLFGGYMTQRVTTSHASRNSGNDTWMIRDNASFVFSLKRNNNYSFKKYAMGKTVCGRNEWVNGKALCVHDEKEPCLFHFGQDYTNRDQSDIRVWKKGIKTSICYPSHYNYPINALRPSNTRFEPRRIVVIQFN